MHWKTWSSVQLLLRCRLNAIAMLALHLTSVSTALSTASKLCMVFTVQVALRRDAPVHLRRPLYEGLRGTPAVISISCTDPVRGEVLEQAGGTVHKVI
jgi:hypothetical protein